MTYSIIGLLAIAIHLILNYEVFRPQNKKDGSEVKRSFRNFMLAVFAYYVTDALWGVFNDLQAVKLLYADTVAYYVAMASSVLLWTRFVDPVCHSVSGREKRLWHFSDSCRACHFLVPDSRADRQSVLAGLLYL